jgi:hypothetical protein
MLEMERNAQQQNQPKLKKAAEVSPMIDMRHGA